MFGDCFRQAKEELGLDHFEVRGWRCVHRHYYLTQLSQLFCARMREKYGDSTAEESGRLTVEQVRSEINVWLSAVELKPEARKERFQKERQKQRVSRRRCRRKTLANVAELVTIFVAVLP